MNSWNFTGNCAANAETRFTQSGDPVVSFSVGVKSGFGEKATTTWARCSMFGKRGESVVQYLTKGQLVGIVGEVTLRPWNDKDGNEKTSLDVRVNDLTLLGKKDGQKNDDRQQTDDSSGYSPAPTKNKPKPSFDEFQDIPF